MCPDRLYLGIGQNIETSLFGHFGSIGCNTINENGGCEVRTIIFGVTQLVQFGAGADAALGAGLFQNKAHRVIQRQNQELRFKIIYIPSFSQSIRVWFHIQRNIKLYFDIAKRIKGKLYLIVITIRH